MNEEVLTTYFPLIQSHFPNAKKEDVEVLCCGYAHSVLKIKDQVFRFPKTKESECNMKAESSFSKRFFPRSPIPIPVITNHTSASEIIYQTCDFISGIPFTEELASSLQAHELVSIAEVLGTFLTEIHSFSLEEARNLSMNSVDTPEEFAKYFVNIIEEDKKVIGSLLTPDEWDWIKKNSKAYYELCRDHPFQLRVTHGDLVPRHILIDENTHQVSGIIDFSPKIADPTIDFRYLDRHGNTFLKTVYDNYLARDPYFDERRKFHVRDLLVIHLYLATLREGEHEQKRAVKKLQEYIAAHPFE